VKAHSYFVNASLPYQTYSKLCANTPPKNVSKYNVVLSTGQNTVDITVELIAICILSNRQPQETKRLK
jgi:hypothetical protein